MRPPARAGALVTTALAVFTVSVAACGINPDNRAEPLGADDIPIALLPTTSSSTTEPPAPDATTNGVDEVDEAPPVDPASMPGGTLGDSRTEEVTVYFVAGNHLVEATRTVPAQPSLGEVARLLMITPPGGVRTLLGPGLVARVTLTSGVARVDLDGTVFDTIDPVDQRVALGQLVLTLTRRPGVGQVRFTVDRIPLAVPRADNEVSAPGAAVSNEDFTELVIEDPAATDASAPTTTQ